MPIMGIHTNESYLKKMVIVQGGMATYFLIAFLYVLEFYPTIQRVKLAIFIASVLLGIIIVTLHTFLAKPLEKLVHTETKSTSWVTVGITLGIATVIITVLMSTYHWLFV
jgi:hypothetical protein